MKSLYNQLAQLQTVDYIIICLAVIAYIPLWIAIINDKEHGAGQNFWTWILWFILDVTQFASIYAAGGLWVMFIAFIPCCFTTTLLVSKNIRKITPFEKKIAVLVALCIGIWITFGAIWAIVFQTISQLVGGLPLLKDTFQKPSKFKKTLLPLCIFLIVHIISFYRKSG